MSNKSIQLKEKRYTNSEIEKIREAELVAADLHADQKRKSGEPYLIHPMAVAQSLADWGMDAATITAGLLHDTVEDTEATLDEIKKQFGSKVAELVDGVTKLGEVDSLPTTNASTARQTASSENIRKLLLAMTHDLRVIVIKLADRRHNLLTLKYMQPEQQHRIAFESLEIYAPLADRLGMGQLKAEIEDLSFKYSNPDEYRRVEQLRQGYLKKAGRYLERLKRFILQELRGAGVEVVSIEGREKHLYSVYKKLIKTDGDIDKMYDLIAIRIIVQNISDCYRVLGILHQQFKPLIYRIKDYIAVPKPNGYRSLHTTVFALDGRIIEIQIRTPEMHAEAEKGLAAHFYYDANKTSKAYLKRQVKRLPGKFTWVSGLADLYAATSSGQEFVEALKVDLFRDRIFVFSPKGDLYDLPEGSTPIDFAFAVHSDIGLRTQGARVNDRLIPLDSALNNRDVVEILTRKQPLPNRDWLSVVKTPHARNRIKAWFRSMERSVNVISGKSVLEQRLKTWGYERLEEVEIIRLRRVTEELRYKDLESLLVAVGEGTLTSSQVLRKLFPSTTVKGPSLISVKRPVGTGRVIIAGKTGLPYVPAPCCKPTFPQPIVGFVTRGKGVTLHLPACHNLPTERERLIRCQWEMSDRADERLVLSIKIEAFNRVGLLRDLTGAISAMGINISGLVSSPSDDNGQTTMQLKVEVKDLFELAGVIKRLERFPGVLSVNRTIE